MDSSLSRSRRIAMNYVVFYFGDIYLYFQRYCLLNKMAHISCSASIRRY
jgi:hypothetical protein